MLADVLAPVVVVLVDDVELPDVEPLVVLLEPVALVEPLDPEVGFVAVIGLT